MLSAFSSVPVAFRDDVTNACLLEVSLVDISNCTALQNKVCGSHARHSPRVQAQAALPAIQADHVARYGSSNQSVRLCCMHAAVIVSVATAVARRVGPCHWHDTPRRQHRHGRRLHQHPHRPAVHRAVCQVTGRVATVPGNSRIGPGSGRWRRRSRPLWGWRASM